MNSASSFPSHPSRSAPMWKQFRRASCFFSPACSLRKAGEAKFIGRVGAELDVEAGRKAAHLAALNALSVARQHLGSLDKVTRVVRLGVSVATSGDVRDQPKVADAASELLQEVFGKEKSPCRLVYGVASLPLGAPVELEVIFEVG